ncbi:MBL fold metallo-hydrolase [Fibrobacter sp. UWB12]|uniref:MBL fold metallo-hydrolase n=1 Tax=Fibrobacter sp. UWB12 TaxID=1896203 RepID=UPI000918ADA7|nr:MBL fold metallo-hydrolase [Fibrobacter sp. UWB12]SHK41426.1 Metallo-beta-lactamase superfamily protein [Fibrobacter sp. UWB12]
MSTVYSHKTFYAIGQGGFFSEELIHNDEKKVIVYDCGTLSPKARIKSEISHFPYKDIDYLVISHLDADHINCIDSLAQGRNIKKIILPHTSPIDLLFFFLNCNDQDTLNSFFNTIQRHQRIEVNADEVSHDVPEYINDDENVPILPMSHNQSLGIFSNNPSGYPLWTIKFYVDATLYSPNARNVLSQTDEAFIKGVSSVADFNNKKVQLDAIYSKISKIRNDSSMAMISAPNPKRIRCLACLNEYFGTWMNGDIVLKTSSEIVQIENHFQDYSIFNFDYQLQHHGSHENFCREIRNFRHMCIYIYYGYNNKHGHPSGTVLRKLKDAGLKICDLTENDCNFDRTTSWHVI